MELAVDRLPVLVDQLEGVRTVPVHEPVPIRRSPVPEQERHLVTRLMALSQEIPEHIGILYRDKECRELNNNSLNTFDLATYKTVCQNYCVIVELWTCVTST